MDINQLKKIVSQFELEDEFHSFKPFGNGHINDTYLIECDEKGRLTKYILQRINDHVFKKPEHVAHNIEKVLSHLKTKGIDTLKTYSSNGKSFVIDSENNYWRLYNFIPNSKSIEVVEHAYQAFEAAMFYAQFQAHLLDVDPNDFYEIIARFHNLDFRLKQFNQAFRENSANRLKHVTSEIDFVLEHVFISTEVLRLLNDKSLPLRITHNDTKLNNVLIDKKTEKGICVIDLDTVMPGSVLFDFGDMIRTFTSPVAEDEKDFSKVCLRTRIFDAICRGYLGVLSKELTEVEKNNLLLGAKYMILMIGLRFLTDYLQGDTYYKTTYPEHNLVRARNQFSLLKDLESKEEELKLIVRKYC